MKKFVIIFLLLFLCTAFYFLAHNPFAQNLLKDRVLLIVIANNYIIPDEISDFYNQNEKFINPILSFIFKTSRENLYQLTPEEIAVYHAEEFLIDRYKKAAESYGKIVVLRNTEATYQNFKETLIDLSDNENKVDIFLNLHGSKNTILFYDDLKKPPYTGESIQKSRILNDLKKESLNIGFVYQTLCYGSYNLNFWIDIGARVVNGAKDGNDFVIVSPEIFLKEWSKGRTFKEAVEKGYRYERSIVKALNFILRDSFLDPDSSQMIFMGNVNYKAK